ncbi:MAG: ATPase F0F1 [Taibaiella sp.]|nr:ATPase F0F1 [Taibaiella sp.]
MNNGKNNMMRYAGLAGQLMGTLAAATWLGWFVDKKTGWNFPLFIIILPFTAVVYSLWKLIKELDKPKK